MPHTVTAERLRYSKARETLCSASGREGYKRLEFVAYVNQSLPVPVKFTIVHRSIGMDEMKEEHFVNLEDAVDRYNELPGGG